MSAMWRVFSLVALLVATNAHGQVAAQAVRDRSSGVDLIVYPTSAQDLVSIQGALIIGPSLNERDSATHRLAADMLTRGTKKRSRLAIESELEKLGASRDFGGFSHSLEFYAVALREDAGRVIELLAEELRSPAFNAEDLVQSKAELAAQLNMFLDDPDGLARETFFATAFPQGHPNHQPATRAVANSIAAVTLEDVKAFHAKRYRSGHLIFVVAGAVDAASVKRHVRGAFGGWQGVKDELPGAAVAQASAAREAVVPLQDKPSVAVFWGQPTGLRYRDREALALRAGTAVLGYGFADRLMSQVRDKEGLTYGIYSRHYEDTFYDGGWVILTSFAPSLLEKGLSATRRELMKWWSEGVTAEELAECKQGMIGQFQLSLASTDEIAAVLLRTAQRGLPLEWLDDYPKQIEALTLDQVNGAIRRRLNPESFTLVKAGTLP